MTNSRRFGGRRVAIFAAVLGGAALLALGSVQAAAQSSSIYLVEEEKQVSAAPGPPIKRQLSPAIAKVSVVAVSQPAPRKFAKHDLVTIVVRETITNDAKSSLETEKEFEKGGKINAIPRLRLEDFLNLQLTQSDLTTDAPEIDVAFDTEWTGEGTLKQSNTFTARITARIIDIKPNDTLVLEARKSITTDGESFRMVLTGTCRKQDITSDNTILSERLYDLSLVKEHKGELRKTTKKGVLTRVFDAIFNF